MTPFLVSASSHARWQDPPEPLYSCVLGEDEIVQRPVVREL